MIYNLLVFKKKIEIKKNRENLITSIKFSFNFKEGKYNGIFKFGGKYKIIQSRKGDRQDEYLIGEDELKYAKEMKIKNRKYFVIDFNNLLKKPLKEIVSSENAKRLAQSEIEKIIKFGLKSNEL